MEKLNRIVPRVNSSLPRQFTMSGREVDYFIPIVCTDRGQHKRLQLSMARRELDGTYGMSHALQYFAPPMRDAKEGESVSQESYIFRCAVCPRTPRINSVRWWSLVDQSITLGLDEIDISLLP